MGRTFKDLFPFKYLQGINLKGKPDLGVTILEVSQATMPDGKEVGVLSFREIKQSMTLNVTNGNVVRELAGSDKLEEWEGLKIYLYHTMVPMKGEMKDAIRVRTKAEMDDIPSKFPKPKSKRKKKKV